MAHDVKIPRRAIVLEVLVTDFQHQDVGVASGILKCGLNLLVQRIRYYVIPWVINRPFNERFKFRVSFE